ncbi:hypothetical protein M9H77_03501 [Catharanthus roseus]|uniref:Uncharacterized protein n=1 Tax=Catharanthus roseus TaxID=4058 RepID=A0ACC0CBX9_CATRO|nr:hypothetical protein M9H77_03501 [Catharanthus roseus]
MENNRNLDHHIYKKISFFTPYLCLDYFLMETKFNSFALIFYRISLEHSCTWTSMLGTYFEMSKVNPLAFEKSILRKEVFEQVCKDFVVEHLYYHIPFNDWF